MAREPNSDLDNALRKGGLESIDKKATRTKKPPPVYQVVGDSKIPVSKAHGAVWKSRRTAAIRRDENVMEAWKEAIRYFYNTAEDLRESGDGNRARNIGAARKLSDDFSEIENLVFANTSALVPLVYSKNPTVEVTATKRSMDQDARTLEKLCNALILRRAAPNFPIKHKMRRSVVMALLTSCSYMEIGWTKKDQSSEGAITSLTEIAKKLETAKAGKDVALLEGQLQALENATDLLRPEGPFSRYRMPWEVLIDPASIEEDFTDARWIMIQDMIPTALILARYATKVGDTHKSIYRPTHVMKLQDGTDTPLEDQIDSFSLLGDGESSEKNVHTLYGFDNKEAYDRAQFTKVWMVWDRTTQRVLMYNDEDWSFPIWVWDDPYHLDSFFPIEPLYMIPSPTGGRTKGEVSYYLDQQDAVNEINSEFRQARRWAQRNIVFNSRKIDQGKVDQLLSGDKNRALGIPLDEGEKIGDVLDALVPPSTNFAQLFDKSGQMTAIDRISSVADVLRGAQFKTNTTNDAVNTYNSIAQTRMDEKIDAVEDFSGGAMWKVAQLCLQFMDKATVIDLLGEELAQNWRNMEATEIARSYSLQIVGGSVVKPSSAVKKQQASEIGQILGQFASASPVALIITLQVFEKAFDEVIISAEDWQLIRESIETQLQQPAEGSGEGNSGQPDGAGVEEALGQFAQLIDSLPPEAKKAIGLALAQGAPVEDIFAQVVGQTQGPPQ